MQKARPRLRSLLLTFLVVIAGSLAAVAIARAGPREECNSIILQARHAAGIHDFAGAAAQIDRASKLCEIALGANSPDLALTLSAIGHFDFGLGRIAEAQAAIARSLVIREKALPPDDPRVSNSLNDLAFLDDETGRYTEAEDLYKRAAAIVEKLHGPDHPDVVRVLNNLAVLYLHLGRYYEAEPLLKRVMTSQEKTAGAQSVDLAFGLNNLGGLYNLQGRYLEAEPLFRRALALREKANADVDESLSNLALLYSEERRFADAEPLIKRALDIEQNKTGAPNPTSLDILGSIQREQHKYADAESTLKRALSVSEKSLGPQNRQVAESMNNLAGLYVEQRQYAEAEPLLKQAMDIREKALGSNHREFATDLYNVAYVDDLRGSPADGEPLLRRALAIQEAALEPDHPDIATTLNQLASTYEAESKTAEALDVSRKAVAILIRRDTQTYDNPSDEGGLERKSNRSTFARLVHLLWTGAPDKSNLAPEIIEEAFRAVQYAGGADTAKAVSGMMARYATGEDALAALVRDREDLANRWKKLDSDLLKAEAVGPDKRNALQEEALRKEQADVDARLSADNDKLRTAFPRFAELAAPRPVGVADVQGVLDPEEAFAMFLLGKNESFLFVIRKQDAHFFRLAVTGDQVADTVKTLRQEIVSVDNFNLDLAQELYAQLFGSAKSLISGAKNLIVAPDGALESLPFAVLVTAPASGQSKAQDYKTAPWLIRRQAVTIQPAASSLVALRRNAAPKRGADPFIGFGDPDFDGSGAKRGFDASDIYRGVDSLVDNLRRLPRLPETADELRTEAKALDAPETSIHLGADATVSTVRRLNLSNARVISFATHGAVANDLPTLAEPALVLTPPKIPTAADDGLLRASEIAQLQLSADFVILSACNTAASDGSPGAEGLLRSRQGVLLCGSAFHPCLALAGEFEFDCQTDDRAYSRVN